MGPGPAWSGLCSGWGGFVGSQEGLRARKKGRVLVQSHLSPSLLNTVGLPITNEGIKSLSSPPSLKMMIFYPPLDGFMECPAEVRVSSISRGARDQGLAPEFASLPTLSFLMNLAAPLLLLPPPGNLPRQGSVFYGLLEASGNVVVLFAKLAGTPRSEDKSPSSAESQLGHSGMSTEGADIRGEMNKKGTEPMGGEKGATFLLIKESRARSREQEPQQGLCCSP